MAADDDSRRPLSSRCGRRPIVNARKRAAHAELHRAPRLPRSGSWSANDNRRRLVQMFPVRRHNPDRQGGARSCDGSITPPWPQRQGAGWTSGKLTAKAVRAVMQIVLLKPVGRLTLAFRAGLTEARRWPSPLALEAGKCGSRRSAATWWVLSAEI